RRGGAPRRRARGSPARPVGGGAALGRGRRGVRRSYARHLRDPCHQDRAAHRRRGRGGRRAREGGAERRRGSVLAARRGHPTMNRVVEWAFERRLPALLLSFLIFVTGLLAAARLPIDAVPDVTNIQVQVVTRAPALSATEVETQVTQPVERAMAGAPG